MKNILGGIAVVIIIILVAIGGWKIERWWHYKFAYQSQVQAEMQPLAKRITDLEARVSALETNKNNNNNNK
jgi:hypothetical protein